MKVFLKKMASMLARTWLWSVLVIIFVASLIWFFGPLLAVADTRFWESAPSRLVSISVLFLLWGLLMVFVSWRSNLAKASEAASDTGRERLEIVEKAAEESREISSRFVDAVRTLKNSTLYKNRSERWRSDLPWYLVMGPTGAGKTSLLDFSGLDFPLNKVERKLTRNTHGTRWCDWYFANDAVLLDTAGRYLTQQDDAAVCGWTTLLSHLHRRRRNRPLNGIIVTIDIEMLTGDEGILDALARKVRDRLNEVHQRLRINVPVYLVITKADRLVGFDAFFDQLSLEESEQVLGASFRPKQNGTDVIVLRAEFDALLQRLNNQTVSRLHVERDIGRRGLILDFPNQLAVLGERLCLFVDMAFTGSRYQHASQLRGFYLTSAPHLDHALDVDTAAIGAMAGMSSKVLPTLHSGRARFIAQLFSRVIFPEADLASLDIREARRIRWRHRALYVCALTLLGTFALAWTGSFSANSARLESIRELATNLSREHSRLAPQDDERAALDALNTSFAASQVFPNGHVLALYELSGLYQGDRSDPTLEAAYEHELQAQLLPRLARLLEDQIRANRNDREQLMNSLRAYLMLSLREHRDSDWLSEWVAANWSVRYRGDSATQEALGLHLQRLLQQPFRYPVNDALVSETRQILRADSLVNLVYRALQDQARHLPEYRLSQNLGPQGAMFTGSDYAIPGFYTQRGYQQNFIVNGPSLVSRILRENWVLGEGAEISGMDLRRLLGELEQVYFRDYANHWGEAVGRVGLQSFTYAADGADLATSLTAASSPLIQLLIEVRDNTRFVALTEVSAALAPPEVLKSSGVGGVAAVTAEKVTADTVVDTAKKSLQRRFEPLHRLLDDTNGPAADLLPALQALNELQLQLSNLARSSQQDQAAYEWARARMVSQRDALGGLRNATRRLPQPVGTWLNTVADDTWSLVLSDAYQFLNQRYQSELYSFYLKAIDKRYPFNAHSTSDVALNDFREFFKAQGVADKFFDGYIRAFTSNDSGGYRLRSVDGRSLPMSRVYLEQMAHVQTIRGSFFAENPNEPQVQFKLEPHTLDPGVSRAEFRFGNQVMEYRHGPIVPASFKWPADADDGRTSLVLEKSAGRALGLEENTGPWSLFRLFDLMQNEYLRGRDVMVLKANVGGLRVNYLLSSQRSPNPFEMNSIRRFRLAGQL